MVQNLLILKDSVLVLEETKLFYCPEVQYFFFVVMFLKHLRSYELIRLFIWSKHDESRSNVWRTKHVGVDQLDELKSFDCSTETDAADPEPGIFHHHGRRSRHPGCSQEQLRDPDHAPEAGYLTAPTSRRGLRVYSLQRQEQEGQPASLQALSISSHYLSLCSYLI